MATQSNGYIDWILEFKCLKGQYRVEYSDIDSEYKFFIDQLDSIALSKINQLSEKGIINGIIDYKVGSAFVAKEVKTLSSNEFGGIVRFTIGNDKLPIYRNLNCFLAVKTHLFSVPDSFYLDDDDYYFPKDEAHGQVKTYINTINLIDLLSGYADYVEDDLKVKTLIFFGKHKTVVPVLFDVSSLSDGLDGIAIIKNLVSDGSHDMHKKGIIIGVLSSLLDNVPEANRFSHLLKNFSLFSTNVEANYNAFISEFSFDKVRDELEEKKRDYILSLNKVFSDISLKLLGIPFALFLAITKIKPASSALSNTDTYINNTVMLLAIIMVAIYMCMLISTQKSSLLSIRNEYDNLIKRWLDQHKYNNQAIIDAKNELLEKFDKIMVSLTVSFIGIWVMLAASAALYFYRVPVIEYLFSLRIFGSE